MSINLTYKLTGALGIFGCIAVSAADIIGIALHEAHDPIADTISMLAIGKYGWIQDLGLDLLAVGFVALAIGLYYWKRMGTAWIIGLLIMVLIAADLILMAEHNQYAGRPGEKIHRKLVYGLAALFPTLLFLLSGSLGKLKSYLKNFSRGIAIAWLLTAPLMPLIPDSLDGAYERVVSSLIIVWLGTVSYHLFRLSRNIDS